MTYDYVNPEMDSIKHWWMADKDTIKSNSKQLNTQSYALGTRIYALAIVYTKDGNHYVFSSLPAIVTEPGASQIAAVMIGPDSVTIQDALAIERVEIIGERENLEYIPQWHVNGTPIPELHDMELSLSPFKHGDKIFVILLWGEGQEAPSNEITILNSPPVITSTPPALNLSDAGYQYTVTVEDPDFDPISYSLSQAPAGMTIHPATGTITWPDPVPGIHTVKVEVTDNMQGFASQEFNLTLTETMPDTDTDIQPDTDIDSL